MIYHSMNRKQTEVEGVSRREEGERQWWVTWYRKEEMKIPEHSYFIPQFCFKAVLTEDNSYLQMQVIDVVLMEKRKEN